MSQPLKLNSLGYLHIHKNHGFETSLFTSYYLASDIHSTRIRPINSRNSKEHTNASVCDRESQEASLTSLNEVVSPQNHFLVYPSGHKIK